MTAQENTNMIRSIFESINQRDIPKIQTMMDKNAEITVIARDQTFKGPEGIKQMIRFRINISSDVKFEIKNIVGCEDTVAVEYTLKGKHDGVYTAPAEGEFPPTGKMINLRCCDLITIKNDKITKWTAYSDIATVMRQIGILHEIVHH